MDNLKGTVSLKKIVIRRIIVFVALWMGVAITLFVNKGMPLLHIVAEEVEPPIYDRYIDRLETMAYPERAGDLGEAGKDMAVICMNALMSDWIDMSNHPEFENASLVYNRLITDSKGTIIQNGVLAAVSSERRDGKSASDDYAEFLLLGYISVDDTFTRDQIKRIRELEEQYGSLAIEINSYTVKKMKYYPKRITIWNGPNMLERFDNLNPNEGKGRFAMVTRYAVDGKDIYKPIAVRCSMDAFIITVATIGIIGVCIKVKRRFGNL